MDGLHYCAGYWRGGSNEVGVIARHVGELIARLGSLSSSLRAWSLRPGGAILPMGDLEGELMKILERGKHRQEVGDSLLPELGTSFRLFSAGEFQAVLSGQFGSRVTGVVDNIQVRFPGPEVAPEFFSGTFVEGLLFDIVRLFDPDWATFAPASLSASRSPGSGGPTVGYRTYFSSANGDLLGNLKSGRCEGLGRGVVVSVSDDYRAVNGEDLFALRDELSRAGWIKPMTD